MLFKKPNFLRYHMQSEFMPELQPIKSVIPKWYKDSQRFIGGEKPKVYPSPNGAIKLCAPFLDSLTVGYSIPLVSDVLVEQTDTGPFLTWRAPYPVLADRTSEGSKELPVPVGFSEKRFVWVLPVTFKLPKGYSALVTHPLNRTDLPFLTLSGVIDADDYAVTQGNLPVFFNTTFEGIVPQGTPIAQLIPFKRDDWTAEKDSTLLKESKINSDRTKSRIFGWYKDTHWKKKTYI